MHLQRQISASCVEGEKDSVADGTKFPYKLVDVLPKYVLNLGAGEYTSDYIGLDGGDTFSVPLPGSYTSASRLSCCFRSTGICRLVIVDSVHGSSTVLLKGTEGLTKGEHRGVIMWQGHITSISLQVPAGDPIQVDYVLWQIPDLTDPDSWQLGDQAIGYVT